MSPEPRPHSAIPVFQGVISVFGWLTFVLLMFYFTRFMGLAGRFKQYVTVYNWCEVIVDALYLVPALFHVFGVVSRDNMIFLWQFVPLIALIYYWFVARVALDTSGGVATLVVAIQFFLIILFGGATLALALHWNQ